MKKLVWVLAMLPAMAFGRVYNYDHTMSFERGDDGFGIDKTTCVAATGRIELDDKLLKIDDKTYKLQPTKEAGTYKAGHYTLLVAYKGSDLYKLKLIAPNKTTNYYIAKDAVVAGE